MFTEDDLLPISALQHLLFCERQCALIHIERLWVENRLTVEGKHLHERAHAGVGESRPGVRVSRGVPLRSLRLGLIGVADVVQFHPIDSDGQPRDPPVPFPVEYKRGRPKSHDADRVQLCAQAMCLEEMLDVEVGQGALFYGRTRRREVVLFTASIRSLTEETASRLHQMVATGHTPVAREEPKCKRCSMLPMCLPSALSPSRSAAHYLARALASAERDGEST